MSVSAEKWELVVGKTRKPKPKNQLPKPEEILPKHQVKSMYDKMHNNNRKLTENRHSPVHNSNSNKLNANNAKSQQPLLIIPPKVKGPSIPHKPKPKNIEIGLAQLNLPELENMLATYKVSFVNSHLVWLQGISAYINANINIDTDTTFGNKAVNYPSNFIPASLKELIYETLENSGDATIQYFYDQSLTSMVVDLSKNLPCVGHKLMLQLIAQRWPTVCVENLAKTAILLNSYQNRSTIGLCLLWAIGQGGYKDLTVGLKVWQNIMVPVIDIKSYRKYVCEYVPRILMRADNTNISLLQNEFFAIFDTLTNKSAIQREYQKSLNNAAADILIKYIRSGCKLSNVFLRLFMRLKSMDESIELCPALVECLSIENDCFKIWKMNYKKHVLESNSLFLYMVKKWKNLPNNLRQNNGDTLSSFLNDIVEIIRNTSPGRHDNDLNASLELIKNLQDKNSQPGRSSSGCCRWFFGSIILIVAIGALLNYDTNLHGGVFAKSTTGKLLQQAGVLPYVETAWTKSLSTSARGYQWAEKNLPIYTKYTCEVLTPYAEFSKDFACIAWKAIKNGLTVAWNYVVEKTPIVVDYIEQYVPGLPRKIQDASIQAWNIVYSTSTQVYESGYEFFKTKVFVGSLSPQSLSSALNRTQIVAAQYYSWFHQKVDTYAKI